MTVIKTILKFLVSIIVYVVVYFAATALLPFSKGFLEASASGNSMVIPFILLNTAWICFTIYYIIRHTLYHGKKLFFYLLLVMFFALWFISQIEVLLFSRSFPVLTRKDTLLIMLSGLFPLLAVIPLLIKFFQNKNTVPEKFIFNWKSLLPKLFLVGIIYWCIYWIFGYFVAWQFEELRIFHSGSAEKLGFFQQVFAGNHPYPVVLMHLFSFARGILFGVFIIPLKIMLTNKKAFIISVCLVYLCSAIMLIIPNVLFPDTVRYIHLLEMTSSMLLFGIITGKVMG